MNKQKATKKQISITEGSIWKSMLSYFFALLLGAFFQQLYNTVDAVIVGRAVSSDALAAVGGSSATVVNLFVGFFLGLSSGATVVISQFFGAGRKEEVSKAVHTAIAVALIGGAIITGTEVVNGFYREQPVAFCAALKQEQLMLTCMTHCLFSDSIRNRWYCKQSVHKVQ